MSFTTSGVNSRAAFSMDELSRKIGQKGQEADQQPIHKRVNEVIALEETLLHKGLSRHKSKRTLTLEARQKSGILERFKYRRVILSRISDIQRQILERGIANSSSEGELKCEGARELPSKEMIQIANKGVTIMSSYHYELGLENFKSAFPLSSSQGEVDTDSNNLKVQDFVSKIFSQLFAESYLSPAAAYRIKGASQGFNAEALKEADEQQLLAEAGTILHNRALQINSAKSSEETAELTKKTLQEVASSFEKIAEIFAGRGNEELKNHYTLLRGAAVQPKAPEVQEGEAAAESGKPSYDLAPVDQLVKISLLFVKNCGSYEPFLRGYNCENQLALSALNELGDRLFPQAIFSKEGLLEIESSKMYSDHSRVNYSDSLAGVRNYLLKLALQAKREEREIGEELLTSIKGALNEHCKKVYSLYMSNDTNQKVNDLQRELSDLLIQIDKKNSDFKVSQLNKQKLVDYLGNKISGTPLLDGEIPQEGGKSKEYIEKIKMKLSNRETDKSTILGEIDKERENHKEAIQKLEERKREVEDTLKNLNIEANNFRKENFYYPSLFESGLTFSLKEFRQWRDLADHPKLVADFSLYIAAQLLEVEKAIPKEKSWSDAVKSVFRWA